LFAPAIDNAAPDTTTYRGLSFPPPSAPGLNLLLRGSYDPQMDDKNAIIRTYLTWVMGAGIPPSKAWDPATVQAYFARNSAQRDATRSLRGQ
jgi:hypothetical protein